MVAGQLAECLFAEGLFAEALSPNGLFAEWLFVVRRTFRHFLLLKIIFLKAPSKAGYLLLV